MFCSKRFQNFDSLISFVGFWKCTLQVCLHCKPVKLCWMILWTHLTLDWRKKNKKSLFRKNCISIHNKRSSKEITIHNKRYNIYYRMGFQLNFIWSAIRLSGTTIRTTPAFIQMLKREFYCGFVFICLWLCANIGRNAWTFSDKRDTQGTR